MGHRVAIVGAGYAGMAAAVTLAAAGIHTTVLESGPVPGGRARRVTTQGVELDNGQHILVGAYTELLRLMRLVGVPDDAVLRTPLDLRYLDGFRLTARFRGRAGLLLAFLTSSLSASEKLASLRFLRTLQAQRFALPEDTTVDALLERHGQQGRIGHYVWRPLCVSALNTPTAEASAQTFLAVLRDALFGGAGASDLLLPRVDLSRLFPEPAADYVRRHGGELRFGATVRDLDELKREHQRVIVAVGPHQLKALLPAGGPAFAFEPIYTCYLQYEEGVRLPFPMLGLAEGLVQWVFDRGELLGERGRLACVISAQGEHQHLEHAALAGRCHEELARHLRLPAPRWSRVIAEKRATIACTPGAKNLRFEVPGVTLAGDYLHPEYPPTLEAATRSGVTAATRVIESLQDEAKEFAAPV